VTPWERACTALRLLAVDPAGLGGIALRARVGPARDAFTDGLGTLPLPLCRLHPTLGADALDGSVDVAATLSSGAMVAQRGLLDRADSAFVLPMAERAAPLLVSRLARLLDDATGHLVVALDEGAEPEETLAPALRDRLAFHVDLEGIAHADIRPMRALPQTPTASPQAPEEVAVEMANLAARLGIHSLRAPLLALRAACAHAASENRRDLTQQDLLIAAELVLAPRATIVPQDHDPAEPTPPQEQPQTPPEEAANDNSFALPDDILLAAIQTALPADVLDGAATRSRASSGSGAGARRIGNRRGRPLPPRGQAKASHGARVDLFATLRAAVPWQTLRRAQYPSRTGAIILPEDLRHKRYLDLSDRLLAFTVDASGSSAVSRLAEAKGAVELLLADAYANRDQVALIAFRGDAAELLLPPTRSLVQTKRRLADLPGGGATPLASGLKCALETALHAQHKGLSPVIIALTDGRGNIALDGTADRKHAAQDASTMADLIAAKDIESIVIDTSNRPEPALRKLALSLRGRYIALPRADARKLSDAVSTSLKG